MRGASSDTDLYAILCVIVLRQNRANLLARAEPVPSPRQWLKAHGQLSPFGPRRQKEHDELFSRRQWVTAYFSPAQVTAHATSTTILRGR